MGLSLSTTVYPLEISHHPGAASCAQVGKDRQRARQTDALALAHMAYADEAPGAAPVGSVLESGVASGVATAAAADEHADDAGTQPAVKTEVRSWIPLWMPSVRPFARSAG